MNLDKIVNRLRYLVASGEIEDTTEVGTERPPTKTPFDAKYRKRRKIRLAMTKASRRINRK